jgi:two-component system cell cycle response regulator CtrA
VRCEAALRERVEQLEAEVAYWKELATCSDLTAPPEWGLRPVESFLAGQLARRGVIRRQTVAQMWPGSAGEDVPLKTIDVHVCRLRKRLKAIGVTLITEKYLGWRVSPDDRARLMAEMGGVSP